MSEATLPVPCVICGQTFKDAMPESGPNRNQPSDGTAFTSNGHYGSTVFDPFNGSMIEVNFCDPCLTEARKHSRVLWRREAKPLVGAPPWASAVFGWIAGDSPYEIWRDDEAQDEMVTHHVESREDLIALIQERGTRDYGAVKLNGRSGTTVDDVWPEGATFADEAE